MQNYKLTIQYDGSRYSGWQVQGNTEQTVQGKLQRVLGALDGGEVEVHGSDADRSAFEQSVAAFEVKQTQ